MVGKYYVIKVDYFVEDENAEDGVGTTPLYLYITRDKVKLRVFFPTLSEPHYDLRWFATREEAQDYIDNKGMKSACCFDNARVEEITY